MMSGLADLTLGLIVLWLIWRVAAFAVGRADPTELAIRLEREAASPAASTMRPVLFS